MKPIPRTWYEGELWQLTNRNRLAKQLRFFYRNMMLEKLDTHFYRVKLRSVDCFWFVRTGE